ncbi:unnamed protein product [Rotaria magnacalcarata]|uniref:Apple domain-containing protein n=2 Tax=Rotaria magnacalcarata TaxID=392030 RepID=A0A816LGD5_9BILA|nr:unnamed protein product [Rotaria magnacalcarata]
MLWNFNTSIYLLNDSISTVSNVKICQMLCLTEERCRTINFRQSIEQCELFIDIPDSGGHVSTSIATVFMTVINGARMPPVTITTPITTSTMPSTTTTTTSTETAATTNAEITTTTTIATNIIITVNTSEATTTEPCDFGYSQSPSGACVNLQIDSSNCGSFGYVCPS